MTATLTPLTTPAPPAAEPARGSGPAGPLDLRFRDPGRLRLLAASVSACLALGRPEEAAKLLAAEAEEVWAAGGLAGHAAGCRAVLD